MCGFLGVLNYKDDTNLGAAWNATAWRGSIYGGWKSTNSLILATRLSRSGNLSNPQPIVYADRYILAFNGEIYNINELCRQHKLPIARQISVSDAECLCVLFSMCADIPTLIASLIGEYSFAFYDIEKNEVLLSRDLFGSKPVYYSKSGDQVIFGSSAKAVSILSNKPLQADWQKIQEILALGVTESANIFKNVDSVCAGEIMKFSDGKILSSKISSANKIPNAANIIENLKQAISIREVNGPTGLAYSGGIDSSILNALSPSLPAYMIVTKPTMDVNINSVLLNETLLKDAAINIWERADRPFSTLTSAAMFLLCKSMQSDGIKNMLTGEGGDELFCGYPHLFEDFKQGHPVLKSNINQYSIALSILNIPHQIELSERSNFILATDSITQVREYDRWVRLPQHLTLLHSDLPSLLNGIETRLPFIDLTDYEISDPKKLNSPKEPLTSVLRQLKSIPLKQTSPRKEGLFISANIYNDDTLIEFAKECDKLLAFDMFDNFSTNCFIALKRLSNINEPLRSNFRDMLSRLILQLSALPFILKKPHNDIAIQMQFTHISVNNLISVKE